MVTFTGTVSHKATVTFVGRLASLGGSRDRLCVCIPPAIRKLIDKGRYVQVTLKQLGTVVRT